MIYAYLAILHRPKVDSRSVKDGLTVFKVQDGVLKAGNDPQQPSSSTAILRSTQIVVRSSAFQYIQTVKPS